MEIKREIIQEDIPQIRDLLEFVFGNSNYISLERLGGLTNHSYHVTFDDGKEYVVRLPGEGTEEVINRSDEKICTQLACNLGIDAELLYFSPKGIKISEYIPMAVTMTEKSMQDKENIEKAAAVFRKLHHCGVNTGVSFDVFDIASTYEKVISDNHVPMPADINESKAEVAGIKREIDAIFPAEKVPCHNDPLCANWVKSGDRLYLIDWEYGGMNDGMWDIAALSIESRFSDDQDQYMLQQYLGKDPDNNDRKHLIASKIFVDYLWTLWAKMRVPYDGQPMEEWAAERYERMLGFIRSYKKIQKSVN